ncbi:hypothetical protein PHMEG_00035331 [Phytophthora megakarya]|uniref:DUF7726 domain-containing protein n=1 Tax=Phytophthora megakarya TaxID=4795 RepID=A0A225UPE5_9STRA|nr:hypothetical protein PHMEG_00035331 [Phytophthora megakarya]
MTLNEFLKECQVNSGQYYRYMNVNGPAKGAANRTFIGASKFFYRREKRAKMEKKQNPNKKRKITTEEREEKVKKKRNGQDLLDRIEDIELEAGENSHPPIFDDCDDIRIKISEFLGEKIITQTAFLESLSVNGKVSSGSLRNFLGMRRGACSGATNVVYRKAYIFFEKKRILEGGEKTKKRLENEAKLGPEGFQLSFAGGKHYKMVFGVPHALDF